MRPELLWLVGNAISRSKCSAAHYIYSVVVCIQAKERKTLDFFFFGFQFCALNSNCSPEGSTDTPLTSGISTNSAGCEHILALGCFSTPNVRKMITGLCSFFFQMS